MVPTWPRIPSAIPRSSLMEFKNAAPRKSKILRLKVGYNPNSSSIGSIVYLFSTKYLVFLSSFGLVTGLIFSFFSKGKRDQKDTEDKKDE